MTGAARQRVPLMPSLLVLVLCLGALVAAALLEPPRAGAENLTLSGFPLPPTCAMKSQFGIPCPGCGLTRSWVAAAHGDLGTSVGFHRLGWLVMFFVALQVLRHFCWLFVPRTRTIVTRYSPYLDKAILPLGILIIINWILLMAGV